MQGEMVGAIAILATFSVPIIAIWTSHARKMAELKAMQGQSVSPDIRRDLTEIKQQIAELRDTTTRFDMSFDAAITRLEERVDTMESQKIVVPPVPPRMSTAPVSGEEQVMVQGIKR